MLFPVIQNKCEQLISEFELISNERRELLTQIASAISSELKAEKKANLVYVCTHNSRRSHLGQIWGAVATTYYRVKSISTFSAGTEATALHPNTMEALEAQGFQVKAITQPPNAKFEIYYGETDFSICFSKTIDDSSVPKKDLIALMTCSDAAENCPFVQGASYRFNTNYEDPKVFDGSDLQLKKYVERSEQIGRETLYLFSKIKPMV